MKEQVDRHHTLNFKKEWELRPEGERLRNQPLLIARMARSTHNELHAATSPVPVPSYHTLKRAALDFEPGYDVLSSMDNLMFAVQEAIKNPRCKEVERALGELTMYAISAQKPYVADGIKKATVIDMGGIGFCRSLDEAV